MSSSNGFVMLSLLEFLWVVVVSWVWEIHGLRTEFDVIVMEIVGFVVWICSNILWFRWFEMMMIRLLLMRIRMKVKKSWRCCYVNKETRVTRSCCWVCVHESFWMKDGCLKVLWLFVCVNRLFFFCWDVYEIVLLMLIEEGKNGW